MDTPPHRPQGDLTAALPVIREAPADQGTVAMIVRRPTPEAREVVGEATLDPTVGLEGDDWLARGSRHTEDGSAEPERQLTIMNSRAIEAIAGDRHHWRWAGDQLYVDLGLCSVSLPARSRLQVGDAVVEVSAVPHTGCAKFTRRYGRDAARFVNSEAGRALNLRGINARVIESGSVRHADTVRVISRPSDASGA